MSADVPDQLFLIPRFVIISRNTISAIVDRHIFPRQTNSTLDFASMVMLLADLFVQPPACRYNGNTSLPA